tara:strand:+ start:649 stop:939 length:291 start_codon:yes stop_codon:yes gene_type:complete
MKNILSQLSNLTEAELVTLNSAVCAQIKRCRAAQSRAMKMTLNEGDTVRWSGKKGVQTGTVTSIKRKFAHVNVTGQTWRVPMNMLHIVNNVNKSNT